VNLKIEDVRIMSMPQFTAEASLYRTNTRYRLATGLASNRVQISPAFKGTICAFSGSPKCPGGFTKWFCLNDSCRDTGICCTPPPPPPPPPTCPSGEDLCTNGGVQGCCQVGTHCCNDDNGCCPNGSVCGSFLGWHFCIPLP
jgi:hypothetical protein